MLLSVLDWMVNKTGLKERRNNIYIKIMVNLTYQLADLIDYMMLHIFSVINEGDNIMVKMTAGVEIVNAGIMEEVNVLFSLNNENMKKDKSKSNKAYNKNTKINRSNKPKEAIQLVAEDIGSDDTDEKEIRAIEDRLKNNFVMEQEKSSDESVYQDTEKVVSRYIVEQISKNSIKIIIELFDYSVPPDIRMQVDNEDCMGLVIKVDNRAGLIMNTSAMGLDMELTAAHVYASISAQEQKKYKMLNPQIYCTQTARPHPFVVRVDKVQVLVYNMKMQSFVLYETILCNNIIYDLLINNVKKRCSIAVTVLMQKDEHNIYSGGLIFQGKHIFCISMVTEVTETIILVTAIAIVRHNTQMEFLIKISSD